MSEQKLDGIKIKPNNLNRVLRYVFSDDLKMEYFPIHPIKYYNLATETVDKHAKSDRAKTTALICRDSKKILETYTYADLSDLSNRFALYLKSLGVKRGDVVACLCNQGFQTAISQLGTYKIGAIFAPFSPLEQKNIVIHALNECQAKAFITQRSLWDSCEKAPGIFNKDFTVIMSGKCCKSEVPFARGFAKPARGFEAEITPSDAAVILLYSSNIDKKVLYSHQLLQSYLTSAHLVYDLDLDDTRQTVWTASEWSQIASILGLMLAGWYFGHTVETVSCYTRIE